MGSDHRITVRVGSNRLVATSVHSYQWAHEFAGDIYHCFMYECDLTTGPNPKDVVQDKEKKWKQTAPLLSIGLVRYCS